MLRTFWQFLSFYPTYFDFDVLWACTYEDKRFRNHFVSCSLIKHRSILFLWVVDKKPFHLLSLTKGCLFILQNIFIFWVNHSFFWGTPLLLSLTGDFSLVILTIQFSFMLILCWFHSFFFMSLKCMLSAANMSACFEGTFLLFFAKSLFRLSIIFFLFCSFRCSLDGVHWSQNSIEDFRFDHEKHIRNFFCEHSCKYLYGGSNSIAFLI